MTVLLFVCMASGCSNEKSSKTLIKFSAWGSQSETAILKPLLREFEAQNPDVKVEFMHIPQNYFQKLHLLFASNLAPDVVFLNNFYSQKYIKANLLEDLTPYFSQELDEKIFFEKAIESSTYKKRLYVVPRDVSDLVVYYNKEIFDRHNLPYPSGDWTFKDYIKTSQTLTSKGVWGTGFEKDPLYWMPFLFGNCASLLSDDGSKVVLDSAAAIESLQTYSDLVNKYKSAPNKSQSASLTMAQLFIQGKLGMQISGRWLVPKYRSDVKFDWDIAPLPKGKCGSVSGIDSSGYAISKGSNHKSEAVKLIKFLSSKESAQGFAKSGLIVPARKDAAYSASFLAQNEKPRNAEAFLVAIGTGKVTPVNENYQKLVDILNTELEPLFLGQKTAGEVVTNVVLFGK